MASRSLYIAQQKGVAVSNSTMTKVEQYTLMAQAAPAPGVGAGSGGGVGGGVVAGSASRVMTAGSYSASAGVPLYQEAQALEQFSRTDGTHLGSGASPSKKVKEIAQKLSDPRFVSGFGSIGGEEFFSYLNISDGLRRAGGAEWEKWNSDMKLKLIKLQDDDGTWAGQHCITGRVAVTSAAILLLLADRDAVPAPATGKKN